MERCSALYAEVQRGVGRLARVCERRKAQLERRLAASPDGRELAARCRQVRPASFALFFIFYCSARNEMEARRGVVNIQGGHA